MWSKKKSKLLVVNCHRKELISMHDRHEKIKQSVAHLSFEMKTRVVRKLISETFDHGNARSKLFKLCKDAKFAKFIQK